VDQNTEYPSYKEAINQYNSKDGKLFEGYTLWSRKEVKPLDSAIEATKAAIEGIISRLNPQTISFFLSPPTTFRDRIGVTAPYKGNRNQPKPKYLKDVESYLVTEYGAIHGVDVEADDSIGIALSKDQGGSVSCSIDKDLLQVPGWHYNWVNDTVRWVSNRDGDFAFYSQMLQGDVTDNIQGLAGIGPVTAAKILSGARSRVELATRVWGEYRREFGDADKARERYLENADLLWILRESEQCPGYQIPEGFSFS